MINQKNKNYVNSTLSSLNNSILISANIPPLQNIKSPNYYNTTYHIINSPNKHFLPFTNKNKQDNNNKVNPLFNFVNKFSSQNPSLNNSVLNSPQHIQQHQRISNPKFEDFLKNLKNPFVEEAKVQQIKNFKIKHDTRDNSLQKIKEKNNKNSYEFLYVIGIGGFGKVWKVYAMKEMSKALIIAKKSVHSVMNERNLLQQLNNPFLVNMKCCFQDKENLYLVMDYMSGGDLRFHIGRMRKFTEEQTKFFIACLILCLEYLHQNNIIHRDIKPENLVLDKKGYVKVTDLGIARIFRTENSNDTSGTPGYMAPEVMCRMNHSYVVDYFAVGVIMYEFMLGRRPYYGRSRQEIREQIIAKQVQVKKSELPFGWSMESMDFTNRLIQRKPGQRLGFNGSQELMNHQWLKNFPFDKLQRQELKAPFQVDERLDNFDAAQIIIEDEENNELIQENQVLLRRDSIQDLFVNYEYEEKAGRIESLRPSRGISTQVDEKQKTVPIQRHNNTQLQ